VSFFRINAPKSCSNATLKITVIALFALFISGCGSLIDRVTATEANSPAPLIDFVADKTVQTVWQASIGDSDEDQQFALAPMIQGDTIYAAATDGQVKAFDVKTGKQRWAVDLDESLSAGPGVGQGLVILGTPEGEVIALAIRDGQQQWRAQVTSEVQAKPLVGIDRIVVTSLDGNMTGFELTGETAWVLSNEMPALNLQGMSSPVLQGNQVLQGTPDGQLTALDIRSGQIIWKSTVVLPTGRSELQRLVDIDADPLIHQGAIYTVTYQGGLVAVGEYSGTVLWQQPFSSYRNLVADSEALYAINENSEVWAFDLQTGEPRWQQTELFKNRLLSDPVIVEDLLVMGDLEGYVHFLSVTDGRLVARVRAGRAPIRQGLLSMDDLVYVQNAAGELQVLRVTQ
jgi:outer membrane protein assembly factor BamB